MFLSWFASSNHLNYNQDNIFLLLWFYKKLISYTYDYLLPLFLLIVTYFFFFLRFKILITLFKMQKCILLTVHFIIVPGIGCFLKCVFTFLELQFHLLYISLWYFQFNNYLPNSQKVIRLNTCTSSILRYDHRDQEI